MLQCFSSGKAFQPACSLCKIHNSNASLVQPACILLKGRSEGVAWNQAFSELPVLTAVLRRVSNSSTVQ